MCQQYSCPRYFPTYYLLPCQDVYQPKGEFTKAKVAFTIHNIAYQGRMWEDTFKDLGLPAASLARFAFTDGVPKVYTEADPMAEDEKPAPATGATFKKLNWMKASQMGR